MNFCKIDLQLCDSTIESYVRYVKEFLSSTIKNLNLLTTEHVRSFLAKFIHKSPNTYANALKALKIFIRDFLNKPKIVESFRFPHKDIIVKYV
ncbi:MAG: phage integrase N-terminal SAM-like domain-containing protein, partial [Candidatus Bathyarchaeia archaeon]